MDSKQWFKQAKYGMMIHFGLYSLLSGEYKGQRMKLIGEWAQSYFRIPNAEYSKLADAFNPVFFNAEEWVKVAKESGMQYMVVTSKHHEGFALFDSEYDNFNCAKGSPFKRDIIAELAEACYKHDLKLGLYYSQEIDWHEPNGGAYKVEQLNANMSWTNDWDFPDNDKKDFSKCFETKIKTQFKELLTKYGDLCLVWCDTPHVITEAQSTELYNMIKKYQPNCLVNSRIGNGMGDYRSCGDNEVIFDKAEQDVKPEKLTARSKEYIVGQKYGLYECPATLNDTWGYKAFDTNWKSPEKVFELKQSLNARGINYLLNIGPDHLGRLPAPSIEILKKVREMEESK